MTAGTVDQQPVSDKKAAKLGDTTRIGVHEPKFTDGTENKGASVTVHRAKS